MNKQPCFSDGHLNTRQHPDKSNATAVITDEVAALRAIVEGTAHTTGADFFRTLVRHLAEAMHDHRKNTMRITL